MSEPQSSGDVDRVLDNIRKLVSTDPSDRPAPRDRLMLTSDLRVPQSSEDADARRGSAPGAGDAPNVAGPPVDQSLEARIAHLESAVAAEHEFEPDGSEAQEPPLPGALPDLAALFEANDAPASRHADADGTSNGADVDPVPLDGEEGRPEQSPFSTTTGTDTALPTVEDDQLPVVQQDRLPATQDDHLSVSESWAFDGLPADGGSSADPAATHMDDAGPGADQANAAVPHGPAPEVDAPGASVPNDELPTAKAEGAPNDAAPQDNADRPDDTAPHFFRAAQPRPGPELPSDTIQDDDALMDEEMLRELVSEIVREELSGALGERITRNVKKLVRREIMRALSAREFD